MKNILVSFALLLCACATAQSQDSYQDPMPYGGAKGLFSDKVTLPAGTLVLLETSERFASDQATVGKVLQFRVRTDVKAENDIAIRTGALALGRVKAIEPATYNHPEELRIELQYVQTVDGQMIPLSGQEQSLRGQFTGQGTAVEAGTSITAFVMNEVRVKVD